MIFSPQFCEAVQSGAKTVTRRPANGEPCNVRCGVIHKVQPGQGQPALPGRIQVTSVRLERLRDITAADAKREGFRGRLPRQAFFAAWRELYGGESNDSLYRIEFVYMGDI